MQINSSVNSSINYINTHKKNSEDELNKLSSGKKVSVDDPAMMQIAQALMSDATVMSQGIQNANESVAMLQIADGTLQNVSSMATDMEALQVRASSASLNSEQKGMIQQEFNAKLNAMNDALEGASYNGVSLFGKNFSTSMGDSEISFSIPEISLDGVDFNSTDSMKQLRDSINSAMSEIGSSTNAFSSSINNLMEQKINSLSAYSQMADVDIAESVNNFKKEDLLTNASLFAQAQQNNLDQNRISSLLA